MSFTTLLIRLFASDLDSAKTGAAIPAKIKKAAEPTSAWRRENLFCIVILIRIKIEFIILHFIATAQRKISILQVN